LILDSHLLIEDFARIVLVPMLIVVVVRDDFSFLILVELDVEDAFDVDIPNIPTSRLEKQRKISNFFTCFFCLMNSSFCAS